MIYKDDGVARTERAGALIDEIAQLERKKLAHAADDQRLEAAKCELAALQIQAPAAPEQPPGIVAHALVFVATAGAAYLGYTLLI